MTNYKKNIFFLILSVICWMTLVLQLVLIIENRVVSMLETLVRFFSFFTILTNILVAIVFTYQWIEPKNKFKFFLVESTKTAVGVYIFVVGFVYNTILRFIWQPKGLQMIVDEMLHAVIPIIYIIFWYVNRKPNELNYKLIFKWLAYPIVYLIMILILGSFSNYYPYPFVDVFQFGYAHVFRNIFYLTLFFGVVSVLFIFIAKIRVNRNSK